MKATDAQVEELARWLDAVYQELNGPDPGPWEERWEEVRGVYRHVARALLERPPPVLMDVLGLPVPDAVAGRAAP